MSDASPAGRDGRYEIRVEGHLDNRWAAWFDEQALTADSDGTTTIRGATTDQAALHGLLRKVRDLGLPLISVTRINDERASRQSEPLAIHVQEK